MYQLCMNDEYGQSSIVTSSNDLEELKKRIKALLCEANVDNALTLAEKKKNWSTYFLELYSDGDLVENAVYAGPNNQGKPSVLSLDDGKLYLLTEVDCQIKFFLGVLDGEDWYAEDERGNIIDSLTHRDVLGKAAYYLRKV